MAANRRPSPFYFSYGHPHREVMLPARNSEAQLRNSLEALLELLQWTNGYTSPSSQHSPLRYRRISQTEKELPWKVSEAIKSTFKKIYIQCYFALCFLAEWKVFPIKKAMVWKLPSRVSIKTYRLLVYSLNAWIDFQVRLYVQYFRLQTYILI